MSARKNAPAGVLARSEGIPAADASQPISDADEKAFRDKLDASISRSWWAMVPPTMQAQLLKRTRHPPGTDVGSLARYERTLLALEAAKLREALRPATFIAGPRYVSPP